MTIVHVIGVDFGMTGLLFYLMKATSLLLKTICKIFIQIFIGLYLVAGRLSI